MKLKRILCILLVTCLAGALTGCFNRIPDDIWHNPNLEGFYPFISMEIGEFSLEEWHENNVVTSVKSRNFRLSDRDSTLYPALSETFEKFNRESLTEAKALMYDLEALATDMQGDGYNPVYCQSETEAYVQRADKHIVSILEGTYEYTGGVHPNYAWFGKNYNPKSGTELKLSEVLTDTKGLPSLLEKKITEKYPDVAFFDLADTFSHYKEEEFTWVMDYQGITFIFSPYEIASYAAGTLSAKIWFDEDVFREEYTNAPDNYVITLPPGFDTEYDLNRADAKKDRICAEAYADEYGSYNMLSVTVNGNAYTDDTNYAFGFDVYLAHMGDKNFIYSESASDNDYRTFCTWEIVEDVPRMIHMLHGTQMSNEYDEVTGVLYRAVFNDPDSFVLETRFDILGTRGACVGYYIDKNEGTPIMADAAYTFTYGHDLKTAIPLEAKLLPDMKKTEIPPGTMLTPYQTDGKSYVDLKTPNGETVRISVDVSEYPPKVNGIPEENCFEEILYAG